MGVFTNILLGFPRKRVFALSSRLVKMKSNTIFSMDTFKRCSKRLVNSIGVFTTRKKELKENDAFVRIPVKQASTGKHRLIISDEKMVQKIIPKHFEFSDKERFILCPKKRK